MSRRPAEANDVAGQITELIRNAHDGSISLGELFAHLTLLREAGKENAATIERALMEMIERQHETLSALQENHEELREFIKRLTAPPYFPAVFLAATNTPQIQGALVQTDTERRVVEVGEEVSLDQLTPGDEVYLSHERNYVMAKSETPSFLTGEIATYSRSTGDGRLVLRVRDEEIVLLPTNGMRTASLKAGEGVRFSRSMGLAFEKIEASKGEEYFLEETPKDSFDEIGGLDREIAILKRALTLHMFHADTAGQYKVRPKRAVLMEGPPGNGKTKVARATCAWLASLSPGGRSHFINVKPGALSSMWHGLTEQRYREIFRVAREAAAADPTRPVIMFWDEIDAVGSTRGESVHRIDDKILNAFMAELDGLEARGNIFILSATNRRGALDPALARPKRLGDLVLYFPQPNRQAARAILSRHMPTDIPYAANGEGPAAAREILLDLAVGQIFAQNSDTELAKLTLRDGKQRVVRASDLISGAQLESIAQAAIERACVRQAEGGPEGLASADINAAISDFFVVTPRALTPRNARDYLPGLGLPQDIDVVRVDVIERKVTHPHRYRVEAA
jgi:proteasome-associated ATPase